MARRVLNQDGEWVDPDAPSPSKTRTTAREVFGWILLALGILVFLGGAALVIGNLSGAFPTFPMAGYLVSTIAIPIVWVGRALSAGTLKEEVKEKWDTEKSESLRFRNSLGAKASVLVVIAFALGIGAMLYFAFNR
jgi:hypothetical protein